MELWIASSNLGKIREFKSLLAPLGLDIHSQNELSYFSQPKETGQTFLENAHIKAKSLHSVKPMAFVVGEDSGLEVEGLNNLPGVHSAKYAGPKASDAENVAKLLKMVSLRCATQRKALLRSFLVLRDPNGQVFEFEGNLEGEISRQQRGRNGFGYDPVFVPISKELTLAEMELADKNRISHRSQATHKLVKHLKNSIEL